jgi:hypothetical protein
MSDVVYTTLPNRRLSRDLGAATGPNYKLSDVLEMGAISISIKKRGQGTDSLVRCWLEATGSLGIHGDTSMQSATTRQMKHACSLQDLYRTVYCSCSGYVFYTERFTVAAPVTCSIQNDLL